MESKKISFILMLIASMIMLITVIYSLFTKDYSMGTFIRFGLFLLTGIMAINKLKK